MIVYRALSPGVPLSAITIYDGSFAPSNSNQSFDLQMQGFYEAAKDLPPVAHITHIVGNGQANKVEQLLFNGVVIKNAPFPGALNGSWDNPTFDVSALVPAGDENPVATMVMPAPTNSRCVSWGAVIFGTTVQDKDGLLDVWEDNHGYTDVATGAFASLPGADSGTKDIFIQIDYLASHNFITSNGTQGHTHKLKQAALDMVGNAFKAQGIHLHVDCGNCYPNDPYVIPGGVGGNVIDEDSVTCHDNAPMFCEFPGQPAIGWKGGLTFLKNQHFPEGAKDSYHYMMFAHELGLATNIWSISGGTLVSIVVSGGTVTVTTASAHGINSGDRVRVSGAIAPVPSFPVNDFALNGTYPAITVTSATSFKFPVANVPAGTYNNPGLFVASGAARSTSGWSDNAGGDSIITLGLWRSDIAPMTKLGTCSPRRALLLMNWDIP